MSFLRNLTTSAQPKGSRFLDVAAAAEMKSPTAPVRPETPLGPSTLRQPLVSASSREEGHVYNDIHEGGERFANVARGQQESDVAGRYADLDAAVVQEDTPPPFRRPRRSTADRFKHAFGLTN